MTQRKPAAFEVMDHVIKMANQHQFYFSDLMGVIYAYKLASRATIHRDDLIAIIKEWWLSKALQVTTLEQLDYLDNTVKAVGDLLSLPPLASYRIVKYERGRVANDSASYRMSDALHYTNFPTIQHGLRDVYESKEDRMIHSAGGINVYTKFYTGTN